MSNESPHLLIAMPCRSEIRSSVVGDLIGCMLHAASWWRETHGEDAQVSISVHPRAHIVVARNEIVGQALELGADWVLFLDDDMKPPPDLLPRLAETGREFVGAVAYKREPPYEPCVARFVDGVAAPFDPDPRDGLVTADLTGFACILVHRRVLELVRARTKGRPFQSREDIGEDWFFCAHAREAGVQLHIVADLVVGHCGDFVVGRAERRRYLQDQASQSRDDEILRHASIEQQPERRPESWPSSPC